MTTTAPRSIRRLAQLQERREMKRLVKQAKRELGCSCSWCAFRIFKRDVLQQPDPGPSVTAPLTCANYPIVPTA